MLPIPAITEERSMKQNTRTMIQNTLESHGWTADRWGNYNRMINGKKYRCKMQDMSMRVEVKSTESNQWVNIRSDYYKNIAVTDNSLTVKGFLII